MPSTELSGDFLTSLINLIVSWGYLGIFLVVTWEYACLPAPSEIVLPFIGYLITQGNLGFLETLLVTVLAGLIGSTICYLIGYYGGTPILTYIQNKFPSSKKSINSAINWFDKYNKLSVLMTRVLPLARTYISVPAGIAKMNIFTFLFFSAIGIITWNSILISLGYFLGSNWADVTNLMKKYSVIIGAVILIALSIFVYFKLRKSKTLK